MGNKYGNAFKDAQEFIRNKLNPKWVATEKLASGESVTGLHRIIRKTQWAAQAEIKAENVVKKKIQQWNKDNSGIVGAEKPNRDELLRIGKGKAYLKSSLDEYPNYWITW